MTATEDLYDCGDFDRFGSTRWNHAQDQYIADLHAYSMYTWAAGTVLKAAVELVSADKARTLLYLIASC